MRLNGLKVHAVMLYKGLIAYILQFVIVLHEKESIKDFKTIRNVVDIR